MIYAWQVHWSVAPAYLMTIPLLGGLSSLLSRKIKTVQQAIVKETTALAGSTTESLRNIELVKSLGLAQQEIGATERYDRQNPEARAEEGPLPAQSEFRSGTFVNLLRTSILFLMLYLIFTQRITVGQFFSLVIYSFFIFGPLQELGNVVNTYRETEVSLQNFEDILAMPPEPRPETARGHRPPRKLVFRGCRLPASVRQPSRASGHLVRGIAGETIAFVGPSGAGKTTLVKLLVGLYRPQIGHIYYNGVPRGSRSTSSDLRERIGFVTQDAQLFSGTIRENLLFVRPKATDAECIDVLRQASVQGLLARAERGLDTVIGEGGVKVSGGEKQRLSIARALLRRPQLLVFDEATSALDSLTEEGISQTIRDVAATERRDHHPDRAPPVNCASRRPHLRAGARTDRRVWPSR